MAILCAILATVFLISTVVLAVVVVKKDDGFRAEDLQVPPSQCQHKEIQSIQQPTDLPIQMNTLDGGPGGLIYNPADNDVSFIFSSSNL